MANTSSRTLRLLSLLQTHRHWPGAELAERLGVSVRTLRRDIDRLRELGYPVAAQRGGDGGYQLAAGTALPPLVLDDDEAVAIAVGLMGAAQSSVTGTAEASVRALAKIVPVMPKRLRRRMDAVAAMTEPVSFSGPPTSVDASALTSLAQACRDSERVRFGYAAADGERTERHVEPHRLVSVGRRWYLVAYDLDRHDWRSFRLDRLADPATTGSRFAPRRLPAADAATFVREAIGHRAVAHRIEVMVEAPAAVAADRIGRWASVTPVDAGSCLVRMNADSLDWAVLALSAVDAEFTVRAPAELVERLDTLARRFSRAIP